MFLDDELEQIYQEKGFSPETSKELVHACINRIPKFNGYNGQEFINAVKRIDGGWQLFCKRHQEFRPEGFRNLYCKACEVDKEKAKKLFGWDINN